MNQIKSIIFAALFLLGVMAFAQQQNPSTQPQHAMPSVDEQLQKLTDKLSLTADQQAKVKSVLENAHQQAQTVKNDNTLSQDDRRTKMSSLHESAHAKIRNILNDDQKKKFDDWQQEMRNRTRQGGEPPPK
jgi:Spy/CpxP family protein refolding chaperone